MSHDYDAVIVGGGHNGLVAAGYLAKAGMHVLVLERRKVLGGAAATDEIFPGFRVNTGADDAGLFFDEIVEDLFLKMHGLEFREGEVALFAPQPDGRSLTLWHDVQKTVAEIAPFSQRDAERFPAFRRAAEGMAQFVRGLMLRRPPDVGERNVNDWLSWGTVALRLRQRGGRDMMELLRVLPMPVKSFLDEWFEGEAIKGILGAEGIIGMRQGPRAAGTALAFLYRQARGFLSRRVVIGGTGQLSSALADAARANGAEIRTGSAVKAIRVDYQNGYRASGVVLDSGEEVSAGVVLSNADPRRTFFELLGPQYLDPQFTRQVDNIIYRGSTAKINLALGGLPEFQGQSEELQLAGRIRIAPSLDYLERASDAAKYGGYSPQPFLDIAMPTVLDPTLAPDGKHIMSIVVQYAAYKLRDGHWDAHRDELADTVLDTLARYSPNLKDLILDRQVLTPWDWEAAYGLTEGSIYHGQMGLDQLLVMRPVPGWSRYRTPIENLYLCGAGTHPGGGVTGAPGYLAAQEVTRRP